MRIILTGSLAVLLSAPSLFSADPIRYNRDVRPILSDACFHCHGPDEKERKGGLRLDIREEALKPAKSGARALVPQKPGESEMLSRLLSKDSEEVMPPPKSHKKISPAQIETLKQWIAQGAAYEAHWAFAPIQNAPVPQVRNAAWIRNPVDAFILQTLERESLSPSPEAAKETLLRRVTLDLTGLPPTPAEIDAFVKDTTPDAYEKVVDRLLGSPHYGERMAIDWLDAARYADSNGYQVDRDRDVWPWRDWVIDAFNQNMPFDRFTIEQIAGDLLPEPTQSQRIATGFHRNHMMNEEGGVLADEFLAEYTADRVETTATVWLGQTLNCSRCHDHKYDPFTQKDFYSLKAFFHNITERGVGSYSANYRVSNPPFLKFPSREQQQKLDALQKQINESTRKLAAIKAEQAKSVADWLEKIASQQPEWVSTEMLSATITSGSAKVNDDAQSVLVSQAKATTLPLKLSLRLPPGEWTAIRLEFRGENGESTYQWSSLKVGATTPAQPDGKKSKNSTTPLAVRPAAQGNSLPATEVSKVTGATKNARVPLSAKPDAPASIVLAFENPVTVGESAPLLEIELVGEHPPGNSQWRIEATRSDADLLVPDALVALARKPADKRSNAEKNQLADLHITFDPGHRAESRDYEKFKKEFADLDLSIPTTLVMEEMQQPRPTFVLMRGAYDKPGAQVTAATPAVLPPLPESEPQNRLGLARWLVNPRNPLPARVTVNRFWQAVFGTGLVRTAEDFGSQGEAPSHPELLDWLSSEFIRSGWDVKAFLRMLVTSSTYRQSSKLTPTLLQKDPGNRLLARGPRFRLQAEFVRDQALAAAGLLSGRIGGPPVRPYHPPGLYEQITAGSGTNKWVEGTGEDLYRRSMYTYWKRSVPHPAMLLFDAPFRESCSLRRPRSNTPMQALNLMNDPTYIEACRAIAQRMLKEGGPKLEQQLEYGYVLLLGRHPRPAERNVLQRAYTRNLETFSAAPENATAFLKQGAFVPDASLNPVEVAAMSAVASAILNADEWITKE